MSNREQFTTEIYVNEEQANDALGKLQKEVDKTAKSYEKLLNTKGADVKETLKAKNAWESAKASLANAEKGVDEYAKAIKNLSGKSMESLLRMQRQINSELKKTKPNTEEWKRLSKEYSQVADRIKTLRREQAELSKGMGKVGKLFSHAAEWGNKYGTAIMALPLAYRKLTAALSGVIKVTKQVINASQTMGDKWNNGMAAMKTTTEAFFMSLSSGDWSAFENGLGNALRKARELAEQLDLLGDFQISEGVMESEYLTKYNQARTVASDTDATPEARQQAIRDMEENIAHYTDFVKRKGEETWKTMTDQFEAWKGLQFDSEEEFHSFFIRYFEYATTGADEAANRIVELKREWQDALKTANMSAWAGAMTRGVEERLKETEVAYRTALSSATKETQAIVAALELPDDLKKQAAELFQSYAASMNKVEQMTRRMNSTSDTAERQINKQGEAAGNATKETDAYAESIKRLDKAQSAQALIWKQQYAAGLIDKRYYEAQVALVEEDFLKQKMATAEKYGKDTDQFMSQLLDKQIARMQKAKELLKEEMDEMEKYAQQGEYMPSTGAANGISDPKAYQDFQEKIWQKAADIRAAITEDSARTEYETEVMWAQKLAEQKKITAEEAERYILQAKLKYAQAAAQQVSQITEQASNFVTALREMESAQLEAQYQADLTAAGDNAEKREEIESEYEQKKLDLQKKYADTEMAINIAKTIANGAVAAIKAFAEGGPYLGIALAALIAATTAAEVATIIAQRNAIKNTSVSSGSKSAPKTGKRTLTGYAEGGYTEDHTTLTTVGERGTEWVAPAWMVRRNPVMIANLERYRKAGSHGRSGSMERGFAEGGFTGKGGGPSTGSGTAIPIADIEAAMETALRRVMQDGAIRAYLVRKDLTELDAQDARFRKQTSR